MIAADALSAKVVLSGAISRKVALRGVGATQGAKAAIEAAGGSVELLPWTRGGYRTR